MKQMKQYAHHWGMTLRIYPNNKSKKIIFDNGNASRFVYNRMVAIQNEMYELKKVGIYLEPVAKRLEYLSSIYCNAQEIVNSAPFLADKEIDSDMVANAILNYKNAWDLYFKNPHTNIPTFHKKDGTVSYKTSNHYQNAVDGLREGSIKFFDETHIRLPKIGKIRCKGSPELISMLLSRTEETRIGSVRIFCDAVGDFFVSISFASDTPFYAPNSQTHKAVGFDLNLENFLWDSDNHVVENPRFKKNLQTKINKERHKLSNKKNQAYREKRKFYKSKNYQKQRKKLARLERSVSAQRENFHYSIAKDIVKSHDYIFGEELKASNLVRNHCLAYAISDAGWRLFLQRLEWSASKAGKTFLLVPPQHTTQTCSNCGYIMKGDEHLTLGDREWFCPSCNTYHVRDYNASVNIMNKGLKILREAGVEPDLK